MHSAYVYVMQLKYNVFSFNIQKTYWFIKIANLINIFVILILCSDF